MKRGEAHPLKNKRTVYAGFLLLIFLSADYNTMYPRRDQFDGA